MTYMLYNKDGYFHYSIRKWKGVSFVVKSQREDVFLIFEVHI